jgi:hypothetical protein
LQADREILHGIAGGGAYYFAKKSITADRAARHEVDVKRKARLAAMEVEDRRLQASSSQRSNITLGRDDVASPSAEAGQDPAPTRHEPETEREKMLEKSKYEAAETFRPPRGNRFS